VRVSVRVFSVPARHTDRWKLGRPSGPVKRGAYQMLLVPFPDGEVRSSVLGLLPVSLAFLRAVYPAAADTFGFTIMQDFEGVAVEDGDDGAGVCHL
jgi:hypothetical protein